MQNIFGSFINYLQLCAVFKIKVDTIFVSSAK